MTTTTTTISIQVPEGAEPGDLLAFEAQGQPLELIVPPGSVPGDILEIEVEVAASDATKDAKTTESTSSDDVTTVTLGNNTILEFFSKLPSDYDRHSPIDGDTDHATDGTFALPWRCGIEMAQRWQEIEQLLVERNIHSRRRILELGSGLGVVGLSLAATTTTTIARNIQGEGSSSSSEQYRILATDNVTMMLTDLPAAMPLLEYNVEHHLPTLLNPSVKVSTQSLRWTLDRPDNDPFSNEPPFDLLLGSDLLYNVEYIPHLIATMKRLLHPTRGVVLLAVRWRKPELERSFFQESGLEWELLQPKSGPYYCPLSWKDFGDPSKDVSNQYFHQTQISVHGKPQSLADIIDEDQAKDLPLEEFHVWERSFIQLYLGKPKDDTTTTNSSS